MTLEQSMTQAEALLNALIDKVLTDFELDLIDQGCEPEGIEVLLDVTRQRMLEEKAAGLATAREWLLRDGNTLH